MRRSLRHTSRSACTVRRLCLAGGLVVAGLAPPAAGAQVPPEIPDSVAQGPRRISPRGAMIRAMLVPGWGHASIGSYNRGAFYFAAEGISFWMLSKSIGRLDEARARMALWDRILRADLEAEGITDPFEVQDRIDADPGMQELLGLEEARRRQREDWMALGIFLMLISGVDAFVSAHLQDFPDPLEIEARPVGGGRIEVGARITLPN